MYSNYKINIRNEISDQKNHTLDTEHDFGPFGPFWAFLGPLWAHFGPTLGPLYPMSGNQWQQLSKTLKIGHFGIILESKMVLVTLGPLWAHFGPVITNV